MLRATIIVVALVAIAGCAPGSGVIDPEQPAGFLWGIWHGWIAPFSLVIGIFRPEVRVYEFTNSGWWYDF